jgi:outer membrane protein OmpA-like peptidoglycan-associated protein
MPDFSKLKPVGEIYTECLNIPNTDFTNGFPGVTNRFENFAIDYKGSFYLQDSAYYTFLLCSDDGSKLFIDNKLIIDNNYQHEFSCKLNSIRLSKGAHAIEVQYFQGPRYKVGLTLQFKKVNERGYQLFNLTKFYPISVKENDKLIEISIGNEILFDFDKYVLSEVAQKALSDIKRIMIDKTKVKSILISGHTDDVGSDEYNMKLSIKRAESVQDFLESINVKPETITIKGFGESKPKFPNDTEEGRKKNRRIEITIEKM